MAVENDFAERIRNIAIRCHANSKVRHGYTDNRWLTEVYDQLDEIADQLEKNYLLIPREVHCSGAAVTPAVTGSGRAR